MEVLQNPKQFRFNIFYVEYLYLYCHKMLFNRVIILNTLTNEEIDNFVVIQSLLLFPLNPLRNQFN